MQSISAVHQSSPPLQSTSPVHPIQPSPIQCSHFQVQDPAKESVRIGCFPFEVQHQGKQSESDTYIFKSSTKRKGSVRIEHFSPASKNNRSVRITHFHVQVQSEAQRKCPIRALPSLIPAPCKEEVQVSQSDPSIFKSSTIQSSVQPSLPFGPAQFSSIKAFPSVQPSLGKALKLFHE